MIRKCCKYVVVSATALVIVNPGQLSATTKAPEAPKPRVTVPFVGCKSDGQLGPVDAPIGRSKAVAVAADEAKRLAYYKAEYGFGVLAPRGWFCFGAYGSSGAELYVSPVPIGSADVLSANWSGFTGPAIQVTHEYGGTSGRIGVAAVIARIFPNYGWFVRSVMHEDIEAGINPQIPIPLVHIRKIN